MIEIAKIIKPQGIQGELKVRLFSDNFDDFCGRGFAYVKQSNEYKMLGFEVSRINSPYIILRLDGVDTRNDAEKYNGVFLYLKREDFEKPDKGEYYICDLIGLLVTDEKDKKLGCIKEVLQHGAADVYVVKGENGFMFPALKQVIKKVDMKNSII